MATPPPRKSCCQFQRFQEASRVGSVLSRNIVGGPVINRGANKREPDCEVDTLAEGEEFNRNECLIMVDGHDGIAASDARLIE